MVVPGQSLVLYGFRALGSNTRPKIRICTERIDRFLDTLIVVRIVEQGVRSDRSEFHDDLVDRVRR